MKGTKFKNTIVPILMVCILSVLFAGLPGTAAAAAGDNGKMYWEMPKPSSLYDIKGYYNSQLLQTTYNNNGYRCYVIVGGTKYTDALQNISNGGSVTKDGIQFDVNTSFVNNGYYVKVEYTAKNTTAAAKTISIGAGADIQIGSNDSAPITKFADGSGFYMTDGSGAQFNFVGRNAYGVTDVDTYWFGAYGEVDANMFANTSDSSLSGIDSGMAYSWKDRVLAAYETKKFSVLYGIGPANKAPQIAVSVPASNYGVVANNSVLSVQGNVTDEENTAGTIIYYSIDGGALKTGYTFSGVPGSFSFNFNPGTLTPGTHRVEFLSQDTSGGTSNSVARGFIIMAAPQNIILTPGVSTMALTWSGDTNATSYDVYRNGVLTGNTTQASFGDTGLAPDVSYSYYVVAKNGSVSVQSSTVSKYTLAAVPGLEVINHTPDQTRNSWSIDIGANAAGKQYKVEYSTDNINWNTSTGWSTATSGTHSGLTAGTTYYYRVSTKNSDGVQSAFSPVQNIRINSAPVISVSSPAENIYRSEVPGFTTFTLSGTVSDADNNEVTLSASINGVKKTVVISQTLSGASWELSWDIAADELREDSYTAIGIAAVDGTGKNNEEGTATWVKTLYLDRIAPAKPAINDNSDWTNAESVAVTVTDGVDTGAAASGTDRSEYRLTGDTSSSWTAYPAAGIQVTNPGITRIEVRTVDKAGNVSQSVFSEVKIDRTPPGNGSFVLSSEYDDMAYTRTKSVKLVNISASDAGGAGNGEGDEALPARMQLSNDPSFDVSTGWIPYAQAYTGWTLENVNGSKTVYIRFMDAAGNVSSAFSDIIIYDDIKPVISISAPSRNAVSKGHTVSYVMKVDDMSAVLSGITQNDSSLVILSGEGSIKNRLEDLQASISIEEISGTERKINITLPQNMTEEGTVSIRIGEGAARDAAGNVSLEVPGNFSFNVDSTPPTHQDILFPENVKVAGGTAVELAKASAECAGGEDGDSVRFAPEGYDGASPANGSTITSTHGRSKFINAPTADGVYRLYIIDAAGNISLASDKVLTVKNNGPAVTIQGPDNSYVQEKNTVEYIVTYSADAKKITLGQMDIGLLRTGTANAYVAVEGIEDEPLKRKIILSNLMGEGTVSIQIAVGSAADDIGNKSEQSQESAAVTIDNTPAVAESVTMASSYAENPAYAKEGDTMTVTFQTNEPLKKVSAEIAGRAARVTSNAEGTVWTASIDIPHNTTLSEGEAAFSIEITDRAGNVSAPVTAVTAGSPVIMDFTQPNVILEGELDSTGKYYTGLVMVIFDEGTATLHNLTTQGTHNPDSGAAISLGGSYVLTVKDKAGNTTTKTFIISKDYVDMMEDFNSVDIVYAPGDSAGSVTRDISLPSTGANGSEVVWSVTAGNAVEIPGGKVIRRAAGTGSSTVEVTAVITKGGYSTSKVFTLTVLAAPSDEPGARAEDDANSAAIYYAAGDSRSSVTQNMGLAVAGINGSVITWTSGDPSVVIEGAAAIVTRPAFAEGDKTVVLTATAAVTVNMTTEAAITVTASKQFVVTLKKQQGSVQEMAEADAAAAYISYGTGDSASHVTENIALVFERGNGSTVQWISSDPDIVYLDGLTGVVVRPAGNAGDKTVTLTVVVSNGAATATRTFEITVIQRESDPAKDRADVQSDMDAAMVGFRGQDTKNSVTTHLILNNLGKNGTTISWLSNSSAVWSDGTVIRSEDGDVTVVLTATVRKGLAVASKTFTVVVKRKELTLLRQLGADAKNAEIQYQSGNSENKVSGNLGLMLTGANGCSITWSSSNPEVISSNGVVQRKQEDTMVTLTVTISKEGFIICRDYVLKVLGQ